MKTWNIKAAGLCLFTSIFGFYGCGADTELEIIGEWKDNYETSHSITQGAWNQMGEGWFLNETIVKFDNETNMLITQNAANATSNPGKFNKTIWIEIINDAFYSCTVIFSKDTLAEVETSTESGDSSDPGNSGCGGAPWSKLSMQTN